MHNLYQMQEEARSSMSSTAATGTPETTAERDARAIHKDGSHDVSPNEIAIGVIIGRMSEFFDFFVYSIASVLVFPAVFFSFADPLTGTLLSFAVFALAFVARPIGTILFIQIDRAWGRGAKLTLALFLLGTATVCIPLIPGFATIGYWSILFLAAFRFLQGIALGGAWDGLSSLLAMNAPPGKRGWYAMLPQLGAPLGLIVASALFAYLVLSLSTEDFLSWGWRYPFFVAFAINVVALFARLRIVVTPEYERLFESRDLQPAPVGNTLSAEGPRIVLGIFTPLASFALFHMMTVFPLSYVFLYTEEPPADFLIIQVIAAVVGVGAVLLSGMLSDRIGRGNLLALAAIGIAVFSILAPAFLGGAETGELIYMIVGFALLGLSFGQSSGATAARFDPTYRYTASALTSDLAWLFGAGFAPLVALALVHWFGLWSAGAYLLSGAICTLVALRANRQLEFKN